MVLGTSIYFPHLHICFRLVPQKIVRKANFEGLTTRSAEGRRKIKAPAQQSDRERERTNTPFLLFVLFKSSVDWMMPTLIGEDIALY